MELLVQRQIETENSTVGEFSINGSFFSFSLEPTSRGLTSDMTLDQIAGIKIPDRTAIPTGRYKVTSYFSPRHQKQVPLLVDVPGYAGVEIHVGNFPQDTDGCLLLGTSKGVDEVLGSRIAIGNFYQQFFAAITAGEDVWITYE
jgi:Family of unknown function (DUF5675)